MRITEVLRKHSWGDLIPHAVFRARCSLDEVWSTRVCRLKCLWNGVSLGPGARIWGRVLFQRFPGSEISIGRNARIVSRPYRYALHLFPLSKIKTFLPSARILIGDDVGFNSACITARSKTIQIGNGTIMGGNCHIMDSDWHPLWPPEKRNTYPGNEHDEGVEIGKNVFIGQNVFILKGVTIGDNSVIGAGSVVTHSIPADSLAAGVPAKVIRKLG